MSNKRSAPSSSSTQKRTRFAPAPSVSGPSASASRSASASGRNTPLSQTEDDDDAFLQDDIVANARTAKSKAKSRVDQSAYASDSSGDEDEDGEGGGGGEKKKEGEDDDVDMFAEDVQEDKKEKKKEFMDLNDIEGQEFEWPSAPGKGKGPAEDSDSEAEEPSKTGLDGDMGVDITPFNMKNEMNEGRFTADGETYVENDDDPEAKYDVWMNDVDKEGMKKARRAHKEQERLEQERQAQESGGGEEKERRERELLRAAWELMQRGETILETLQRLGKEVEDERRKREKEAGQKKKSWAEKQKERKALMAAEEEQKDSIHTSNPFTNLSNIVSGLTTIGHLDVYSLSCESIQRMLPAAPSNDVGEQRSAPPKPKVDNRQFQYRFSLAYVRNLPEGQRPVEREAFGMFSLLQLRGWKATGFFGGPNCENVELRVVGQDGAPGPWGSWAEIIG
ncbi:hypothetical protein B9479_001313 [Cryptococcus floricola]|uniref:GYF domain-containing protein n=1 Tax=Cryptococcus floricola TaxID=2591691 RepID=A0A5D3B2M4_9TREE|nr:hypothetical protein B9479_001313 [Cryptococcus floricola]